MGKSTSDIRQIYDQSTNSWHSDTGQDMDNLESQQCTEIPSHIYNSWKEGKKESGKW